MCVIIISCFVRAAAETYVELPYRLGRYVRYGNRMDDRMQFCW